MAKKKLQIMTLNLGINPEIEILKENKINEETSNKIKEVVAVLKQEKDIIEKGKSNRKSKEVKTEEAFAALMEATNAGESISGAKLLYISNAQTTSSIILRLRRLIKERGNKWEIIKSKKNRKTYYSLRPTV